MNFFTVFWNGNKLIKNNHSYKEIFFTFYLYWISGYSASCEKDIQCFRKNQEKWYFWTESDFHEDENFSVVFRIVIVRQSCWLIFSSFYVVNAEFTDCLLFRVIKGIKAMIFSLINVLFLLLNIASVDSVFYWVFYDKFLEFLSVLTIKQLLQSDVVCIKCKKV